MALDLDPRQRAMLLEMQVRVWSPTQNLSAAATAAVPARATGAAAAASAIAPPATRAKAQAATLPQQPTAVPGGDATPAPAAPAAPGIDGMDWPALTRSVLGCSACGLCVGRKAAVFSPEPIPRQADWLVLGEPPDEYEERAGLAFAGAPGELLDNMLRAVSLTRDGVGSAGARVTNVVKCRPAAVRNPLPGELATCAVYLRREISLVQPKVILAMGRFAAQSLLGSGNPELAGLPFGRLRGQVHRFEGVPVVVTHHPARLLRAGEDKAGAWADLCLAQSAAREVS